MKLHPQRHFDWKVLLLPLFKHFKAIITPNLFQYRIVYNHKDMLNEQRCQHSAN